MTDQPNQSSAVPEDSESYDVFYEKSPQYAALHCDGVIVSPNGQGSIVINFYSERFSIPKQVKLIKDDSDDDDFVEKFVDGKRGIFRQIEASVFLNEGVAGELINWLTRVRDFLSEQQERKD